MLYCVRYVYKKRHTCVIVALMGRQPKPYKYYIRSINGKNIWYYSISTVSGVPVDLCENRKSSGIEAELDASGKAKRSSEQRIVRFCMSRIRELKTESQATSPTLVEYLAPYFTENCPHIARIRADRKRYREDFRKDQRSRLDRLVITHPIAAIPMDQITPGDFEDLKQDLRRQGTGIRTVNLTIGAIRTAINEGIHRGELKRDPMIGVGNIREEEQERGIFSIDELRRMFAYPDGFHVWGYDKNYHGSPSGGKLHPIVPYTFALMMAGTGERPSAILRLNWGDLSEDVVTFPLTKTRAHRSVPVAPVVLGAIEELSDAMVRIGATDPIFCHDDTGKRLTYSFFEKRFSRMMKVLELPANDADGRKRTPYSLKDSLITHLIDGGADPVLVREYVGHSHGSGERSLTRVQSRYKKSQVEKLRALLDPIQAIFESSTVKMSNLV